jgi:hypothetical protein
LIDRRGAFDILGRPLTPKEAMECEFILGVERAYFDKKRAKSQADWAEKHKVENDLLNTVIRITNG